MLKKKVQIWVFFREKDGKTRFLALQTTEKRGGFWQPVTGSVERGEGLLEAARRETQEETGLILSQDPFPLKHSFFFESRGDQVEEHAFAVEVAAESPIRIDPNEHQDYQWVDAEAAHGLIRFESNIQVLKILTEKLNESII